jgi:CheY-like chemotaxis protein
LVVLHLLPIPSFCKILLALSVAAKHTSRACGNPVEFVRITVNNVAVKNSETEGDSNGFGMRLVGKDIMVVDDEVHITGLVDDMLTRFGARVQTAHSVAEAFSRLRSGGFDLVVCDQNLPDMSGQGLYGLMANVASMPRRFLFITGSGSVKAGNRLEAGAGVDFLQKPFRMHELVAAIDRLLGQEFR